MWLHRLNRVVAWRAMEVAGPLSTPRKRAGPELLMQGTRAGGRAVWAPRPAPRRPWSWVLMPLACWTMLCAQ